MVEPGEAQGKGIMGTMGMPFGSQSRNIGTLGILRVPSISFLEYPHAYRNLAGLISSLIGIPEAGRIARLPAMAAGFQPVPEALRDRTVAFVNP